jgi:hypothetical protein
VLVLGDLSEVPKIWDGWEARWIEYVILYLHGRRNVAAVELSLQKYKSSVVSRGGEVWLFSFH